MGEFTSLHLLRIGFAGILLGSIILYLQWRAQRRKGLPDREPENRVGFGIIGVSQILIILALFAESAHG